MKDEVVQNHKSRHTPENGVRGGDTTHNSYDTETTQTCHHAAQVDVATTEMREEEPRAAHHVNNKHVLIHMYVSTYMATPIMESEL